mmetsp:Transcript_19055/g.29239  ORF Transcript_19055/g.29239 Transcript_19055/m.29239 type:complete len:93 (-) Transcript_19055:1060-1338(-)
MIRYFRKVVQSKWEKGSLIHLSERQVSAEVIPGKNLPTSKEIKPELPQAHAAHLVSLVPFNERMSSLPDFLLTAIHYLEKHLKYSKEKINTS